MQFCCKFTTKSVSEKKFENRLIFGEVMGKSLISCFFLTDSVYLLAFGLKNPFIGVNAHTKLWLASVA